MYDSEAFLHDLEITYTKKMAYPCGFEWGDVGSVVFFLNLNIEKRKIERE